MRPTQDKIDRCLVPAAIRVLPGRDEMPSWVKCTMTDGTAVQVNLDQVAMIRAYRSDRGFSGSEIVFATGTPSPVIVNEDREVLLASLHRSTSRPAAGL
jgi:hypothetical protein